MKKVLFLIAALATFAFAGDGETIKAYSVLAAGVGLGRLAFGGAFAAGKVEAG